MCHGAVYPPPAPGHPSLRGAAVSDGRTFRHRVSVGGLPAWMDAGRLLGAGPWTAGDAVWSADLLPADAADLSARLRGLGFDGQPVQVEVRPGLSRTLVRDARTVDARRRRDTTPGFLRPGTKVDDEGRMSLTPEVLAVRLGQQAAALLGPDGLVVDAGCGAGGNTIGFARAGLRVLAVERDAERLVMARHNARVYGVVDRIRFVVGDALEHLRPDALVFVDPPWGADWDRSGAEVPPMPLLDAVVASGHRWWAKLPPSYPVHRLGGTADAWFGEADGDRRRVKFVRVRSG